MAPNLAGGGAASVNVASLVQQLGSALASLAGVLQGGPAAGSAPSVGAALVAGGANAAPAAPVATTAPASALQLAGTAGLAPTDRALIDTAVATANASPTAVRILSEFNKAGATIKVLSDEEFAARGQGDANGSYDTQPNVMYLRRSDLQRHAANPATSSKAVLTLVHEAAHAIDDSSGLQESFIASMNPRFLALGGSGTAQGVAFEKAVKQQLVLGIETRAFFLQGSVARELNASLANGSRRINDVPLAEVLANDTHPSLIAATGGSFEQVWQRVQQSTGYNPEQMNLPPTKLGTNILM